VFTYANTIPCSLAWEAFGEANGAASFSEMRQRIARYRHANPADRADFVIDCRILTQPFFFAEPDWIPVTPSWTPNIVTFKTYDTSETDGAALWDAIQDRLARAAVPLVPKDEDHPRCGAPTLVRPRLGQGTFRLVVTDAYQRKCAVTGERTLPALEAAHIRPFADATWSAGFNRPAKHGSASTQTSPALGTEGAGHP
jgi:putative restriction endonuclease